MFGCEIVLYGSCIGLGQVYVYDLIIKICSVLVNDGDTELMGRRTCLI
jgi:hypothetical protein